MLFIAGFWKQLRDKIVDAFASLNTAYWTETDTAGLLAIAGTAHWSSVGNGTLRSAELNGSGKFVLEGNFDIQIDYAVTGAPNGFNLQLRVVNSADFANVYLTAIAGVVSLSANTYIGGSSVEVGTKGSGTPTTGKLRITRVSTTVHMYYHDGTNFVEIGTGGTGYPVTNSYVYLYFGESTAGSNEFEFDNFVEN